MHIFFDPATPLLQIYSMSIFKHIDNSENKKEFKFDMGFDFRYIRVRSNKPDDAGQVGGQMSVAELQLFE